MKIKKHIKKSGREMWTVVKYNGLFEKDSILYMDQSKKACEHYIKRHEQFNR